MLQVGKKHNTSSGYYFSCTEDKDCVGVKVVLSSFSLVWQFIFSCVCIMIKPHPKNITSVVLHLVCF